MAAVARPLGRRGLAIAGIAALVAVGVAQMADLATFVWMVERVGIEAELNPLVAYAATAWGMGPLAVAKVGLVIFVVAVFVIVAPVRERFAASLLAFATMAGLVGALSNTAAVM